MMNLQVDTNKLKECGEDILILTKELKEEFEVLFTRISNMNTRTFEWVGKSANEYVRRTNIERIQYNKVVEVLNQYGKVLVSTADSFDTCIRKKVR